MTKRRKFFAIAGLALAVGGAAVFSIYRARRGVVAVEAAPVARKDLTSIVTASGEIRPKNYTNVLAEGFGKITEILVHEGQWVRQGDVLLRVESTQPAADVAAQRAALSSAEAAVRAAEASYRSATAEVNQQKANLDKARFDWEQGQKLYSAQLIALQEYQARKAAFEAAQAALSAAQARMQQTRAQLAQARAVLDQTRAQLTRVQDVLRKTTYRAHFRHGDLHCRPRGRERRAGDSERAGQLPDDHLRHVSGHGRGARGRNRYHQHPDRPARRGNH